MSPPMTHDEKAAIDARLEKLEHNVRDTRAESRQSAQDGKFSHEQALAAIITSTNMAEGRDHQMSLKLTKLATDIHTLASHQHGTDLELAKQGADLRIVKTSTARLNGILAHPTVRLVIQAVVLIGAAYATEMARKNDKLNNQAEPAHTAAPMHP